ncbi:hypothetical protein F5Y17DRAFT_412032, partial [Xylariaceae sp. FL0594]
MNISFAAAIHTYMHTYVYISRVLFSLSVCMFRLFACVYVYVYVCSLQSFFFFFFFFF